MISTVRCAVIGLGMGARHAEAYLDCPGAKLVAVANVDPRRFEKLAGKVAPENCFNDYKAMLKQIKPDLVSVALPNFLHARVTIDCLKAGAHVLCEKPMAMNLNEALKMTETARKAGLKLGINFCYRFTAQAQALKDMANDGFLGEPYHAYTCWTRRDGYPGMGGWFSQKKLSGGGALIDLGIHRLDFALWLMGNPAPVSVSGMTHYRVGIPKAKKLGKTFDVEDFASGFIRLDNGASLIFESSWGGHQEQSNRIVTVVTGTKGTLVHRNQGNGYDFVAECFSDASGHRLDGVVAALPTAAKNPYHEMVKSIVNDTRPPADAEDGVRVQRIVDGLYRSAVKGKEVRL